MKDTTQTCCEKCDGSFTTLNHHEVSNCLNIDCKCHTDTTQEWAKEFEKARKGKVSDHMFDGSCCYNNNEDGQGHVECRYPHNPGRENASGVQCLKLKEEHFDVVAFITKILAAQRESDRERVEKSPLEELIEACEEYGQLLISCYGKGKYIVRIGYFIESTPEQKAQGYPQIAQHLQVEASTINEALTRLLQILKGKDI